MVSESKMGHQSELLQDSKTSESSEWKPPAIDFKDILSMDDIVRLSLIDDNWKIVESKRSRIISTLPKFGVKRLAPPQVNSHHELSTLWTAQIESQKLSGHNGFPSHMPTTKSELNQGDVSADKTIDRILEEDSIIGQNVSATRSQSYQNFGSSEVSTAGRISNDYSIHLNGDFDGDADVEEALLSITSKKKKEIPLPEFDDLNSDDDEEYRSENQWSLKDKGSLYLYENLVGVDLREPLFMFVPQSNGNNIPRIGELDVDQLSELSENDSKSEENPELGSDLEAEYNSHRQSRLPTMDSCIQTDNSSPSLLTKDIGTMTANDIVAEITAERSKAGLSAALMSVSSEFYETDPKFIQSPESCVEVLEGEAISISCTFTGTQPIDVFWFRDVDGVTQLEENDRCDIGCSSDVFCLDLFNATMEDARQYLCIGVNTKGHCVRSFQIKILENRNPKFPASFSVFPQSVEALESAEAKLSCKVSGYPPPRVLWFCGNERLKNGEKYKIESSAGNEHCLTVCDVGKTSTEYLVMAQNFLEKVKATAHIHIKKEDSKEKQNTTFESSAKSPYPNLDELVKIVQKVSPSVKEEAPPNFSSRFLTRLSATSTPNLPDEQPLTSSKQHTWIAARSNSVEEEHTKFKDWQRKHDNPVSLTTQEFNKDLSDDEQRIDISYRDFERLYNAKLITQPQLKSGRVRKKDLVKIHNFLKEPNNSTSNDVRSSDTLADDATPLYVNCGLKEINSDFYRRDYVINESSKHSDSKKFSKQNHHAMHRLAHASSLQSPVEGTWPQGGTHMEHLTAETKQPEGAVTSSQLEEDVMLPCVRELCSKFSGGALSPELRHDDTSPLKRVYSLTGRSIPQYVRDRIERRLSESDHTSKQPNELDSSPQNVVVPILQSPVDVKKDFGSQGSSYHSKVKPKRQSIERSLSLNVRKDQDVNRFKNAKLNNYSPVNDKSKSASQTAMQGHRDDIRGDVVKPQKKLVNTVVMKRAAYWNKRVLDEPLSDPFPEMMADSDGD